MTDETVMIDVMEQRAKRREERRDLFRMLGGKALAGGAVAMAATGAAEAQTAAPTDADILNFALNLEYLEAEFYSFAVYGVGLDASLRTGTGTQGLVSPGRRVAFSDPVVAQYALEIAQDEIAHVRFLRQQLGAATVAEPAIDVGPSPAAAVAGEVGPEQLRSAQGGHHRPGRSPLVAAGRATGADPAGSPFFSRASTRAWRVSSRARRRKSRPEPSRKDSHRSMTWPSGAEPAPASNSLAVTKARSTIVR